MFVNRKNNVLLSAMKVLAFGMIALFGQAANASEIEFSIPVSARDLPSSVSSLRVRCRATSAQGRVFSGESEMIGIVNGAVSETIARIRTQFSGELQSWSCDILGYTEIGDGQLRDFGFLTSSEYEASDLSERDNLRFLHLIVSDRSALKQEGSFDQ